MGTTYVPWKTDKQIVLSSLKKREDGTVPVVWKLFTETW